MSTPRVAVIAVHGVADHKPGETAEALIDLMVGSAIGGASGSEGADATVKYMAKGCECFTLSVEPLRPAGPAGREGPATPYSEDRPMAKSFAQSLRSDMQEQAPVAATAAPVGGVPDEGLKLTDFLLRKHYDNGGTAEPFASKLTRLKRTQGDAATHDVDVFEMYWADLSRLSDQMPRIVGELFTLLFRFSRLGRDTVGLARSAASTSPAAWRVTSVLQEALDWLLVHVVAMFTLQLIVAGLTVMAVGAAISDDSGYRAMALPYVPWVYMMAGLLLLAYRASAPTARELVLPVALLLGGVAAAVLPLGALWGAIAAYFAFITLVLRAGLRVADDRFPFVKYSGLLFWTVAAFCMLVPALFACGPFAASCSPAWPLSVLLDDALRVVEGVLFIGFRMLWTFVIPWVLLAWMVGGLVAGWRGQFGDRAAIGTGRLGVTVSMGAFLAIVMLIWATAHKALPASVGWAHYQPWFFSTASGESVFAREFLQQRFAASTAGFVLIVLMLGLLVLYLTLALVPSILAELLLLVDRKREAVRRQTRARGTAPPPSPATLLERGRRARQLGKWLTFYYRYLDWVTIVIALLGLGAAVLIAVAFAGDETANGIYQWLQTRSDGLLEPLAISATGFVAFLIAFGGLLSKYAPTLRGPLDVAMDVDNHFREFPRAQIPRARIFSRYVALLKKIQQEGYDRIVIVAHSQGTVISTELLRHLASPGGLQPPRPGDLPTLPGGGPFAPINLLTLGCPLRQLYAARFPFLYQWVRDTSASNPQLNVCGPKVHDVGVQRWFNAFCSGDYVGRWLWSHHTPPAAGVPMSATVFPAQGFDRIDAYALMQVPPLAAQMPALQQSDRIETCLGVGAHTHYFDPGQDAVAWLVDHLIAC